MANTTIKITQLPSIGNNLTAGTLIPVVAVNGITPVTDKITVGNVANFTLTNAGSTLPPALLSIYSQTVTNAAQPNITSVGTLNVSSLKISGGDNGYYLQTNGTGNLAWVAGGGSGNGVVGGSDTQIQFNNAGNFGGNVDLTWIDGNIVTTGIKTDNYYYANGQPFSGGGGLPLSNGTSNIDIATADGNVTIVADGSTWTFDTYGNLTLPNIANPSINYANGQPYGGGGGASNKIYNGNSYANIDSADGNLVINANSQQWTFGTTGVLSLPNETNIYGNGQFQIDTVGGFQLTSFTDNVGSGAQTWSFNSDGSTVFPGTSGNITGADNITANYFHGDGSQLTNLPIQPGTYSNSNVESLLSDFGTNTISTTGNVSGGSFTLAGDTILNNLTNTITLQTGGDSWTFGTDGNLTLPSNTSSINYANGDPYGGGGSANTGNVTFDNITIQGVNGLNLSAGTDFTANSAYLRVRSGDYPTHIHFDTGNNQYFDQYFGADAKFVKVEANGNVVINADDYAGNGATWTFGADGTTQFPANTINTAGQLSIKSFDSLLDIQSANTTVGSGGEILLNSGFTGPTSAGVTIAAYVDGTLPSLKEWVFDATGNLTLPANTFAVNYANGTQAQFSQISKGNSNVSVPTSSDNVYINTNDGNSRQWIFNKDGSLRTPGNVDIYGTINFPQQVSSINWSTYNIELSQYGRINTNVDFFANANVIGAQYLKGDGSNISNISGSNIVGNVGNALNAYAVAAANVTGLGNLALLNKDGNSSNVLYGNGVFASVPATYGNSNVATFLASFGSNTISTTGNINGGNITVTGTANTGISSIVAGVTNTLLPNTIASFSANVNSYTQVTLQNKSNGADATADYIITADNGSDTVNYADFGIINSGYDNGTPTNSLGNIVYAADTYLYAQGNTGNASQSGGNLAIGTTVPGKNVKIFAGGVNNSSIIANIANTGMTVTGNITVANGSFVGNGAGLTNVTVNAAGNIQGTSSNVSLIAGSYTSTFDNTGNLTVSGNIIATGGILAVPAWTSAGAITFGATTTAPTKPTARVQDNISYRQLGAKQWEVIMSWLVTSATGSVNGTGDYLFTLPNSLSFDTTLPSQQIYTGGVASSSWNTASYIIPSGSGVINNGTVGGQVYPLVYNGTTFRILTTTYNSAVQCWGAGYYGAACPGMQLTFRFTST